MAHPKWWHISLKVQDEGAATDPIPHPTREGVTLQLLMNLKAHAVDISTSDGGSRSVSMAEDLTATEFGDRILTDLGELGIEAEVEREKFEDDSPRSYDKSQAASFAIALVNTDRVLKAHRSSLTGDTGPVQLWPHNFDLAFEWFGTLMVTYEEEEGAKDYPSQINFGFAPGDSSHEQAYFYSNPWPFQESLIDSELPSGARWFTESWKGTILPYAEIAGDQEAQHRLDSYFRAVYKLASPLLSK